MSSVKSAMLAMGYTGARQRTDTCRCCKHFGTVYVDRMPPYDKAYYECGLGKFRVTEMAICDRHELRKSAA